MYPILKKHSYSSMNTMGLNYVKEEALEFYVVHKLLYRINSLYKFIVSQMVEDGVENDNGGFVSRIVFSDEGTFHLSGNKLSATMSGYGVISNHT